MTLDKSVRNGISAVKLHNQSIVIALKKYGVLKIKVKNIGVYNNADVR